METTGSDTQGGRRRRGKGEGRRDNSGQERALEVTKLNEAMPRLLKLRESLAEAAEDYSALVKKTGEASGFNASVIRKLVDAKHGDKFDEAKRIVDQLGSAFELVG